MVSRSVRSEFVRLLMETSGQKEKTDVVQELTPSQIKRNNVDMNKISTAIWSTLYHFLTDFRAFYCISTGKVISEDFAESIFILATQAQGQQWYKSLKQDASLMVTVLKSK